MITEQLLDTTYLLEHEQRNVTVHLHPVKIAGPALLTAAGLAAIVAAAVRLHLPGWLLLLAAAAVAAYFVWRWANYWSTYFLITTSRLIFASGVFEHTIGMMPLTKVTDMSLKVPWPGGRALNYGTFIVESAGQDQALQTLNHLPYPNELYLEICAQVFPPDDPRHGGTT